MTFALFHWTARKPTLIARSRPAGQQAPADAKQAPVPRQDRPPAPATATVLDAPTVASVSRTTSARQPARQDQRPQRRSAGQEQDTGANRHRRRLHTHNADNNKREPSD